MLFSKKFTSDETAENLARRLLLLLSKYKKSRFINRPRIFYTYIIDIISSHVVFYPSPICLTYAWSFGSLAGLSLVIQLISGTFLSMHYTADTTMAFKSIEYIMRDIPNGWLIRYIHSNGASMFFMTIYGHVCKALYYGSYMEPRQYLWCSGVILLLLTMGAAFTGYVLPWGQMSFWGATVITSMVTALPGGKSMSHWLWGGEVVGNPTLHRFYTVHFILPYIISVVSLWHLSLLHKVGSNSPIGSDTGVDDVPFYPYFVSKDLFAFTVYGLVFGTLVFWFPNLLNHPDNCVPANPMRTPPHVVPEWYFLPYYAILRAIPHKAAGISAMFGSLLVLFIIPFSNTSYVRNTTYRPLFKVCFWMLMHAFVMLFWLGQCPLKNTYARWSQYYTIYYFVFFTILIPIVGKVETFLVHYKDDE